MRVALATLLSFLLIPGVALAQARAAGGAELSARDIAHTVLPATVLLFKFDSNNEPVAFGSGFVVTPTIIATNYHVIKGAAQMVAKLVNRGDGYVRVEKVITVDRKNDLALLQVEPVDVVPLPLEDRERPAIGDTVYVAGNPEGYEGTFSQGIISSIRRREGLIQIDAAISHGSSGGPVVNAQGRVIGVAKSINTDGQNLNFAVPVDFLISLLTEGGEEPDNASAVASTPREPAPREPTPREREPRAPEPAPQPPESASPPVIARPEIRVPPGTPDEIYKSWKKESNPAKKLDLCAGLIWGHFGTKAAETAGYASMFDSANSAETKVVISVVYYLAGVEQGRDGAYTEYALGNAATLSKDPRQLAAFGEIYLQRYPSGRYAPYVVKASAAAHYLLFDAALKEKRYTEALEIGMGMMARENDSFIYAYRLASAGLGDLTARGAKSIFLGRVQFVADRAIAYVESGNMPNGANRERWNQDIPTTLALLYKARGVDAYYMTAKSNPASMREYDAALDALRRSVSYSSRDPITYYFFSQIYNSQYAAYSAQYEALPTADQTGPRGSRVLEDVNAAADNVIDSLIRVIAYAGSNQALIDTVSPQLSEYWKYRHPDSPNAWIDEVNRLR